MDWATTRLRSSGPGRHIAYRARCAQQAAARVLHPSSNYVRACFSSALSQFGHWFVASRGGRCPCTNPNSCVMKYHQERKTLLACLSQRRELGKFNRRDKAAPGGCQRELPGDAMTVTALVAVLGLISGVTGTVLGVLNFLRDRAAVEVSLQWDMSVTPGTEYDVNKKWGVITVANIGRRPIFVSHVAIRLPKRASIKGGYSHLVIPSGITGKTLTEGAPAERYVMTQDGLDEHAAHWRGMVAQVSDTRGRVWSSKKLRRNQIPSWAEPS
jgi:hypothetical protein